MWRKPLDRNILVSGCTTPPSRLFYSDFLTFASARTTISCAVTTATRPEPVYPLGRRSGTGGSFIDCPHQKHLSSSFKKPRRNILAWRRLVVYCSCYLLGTLHKCCFFSFSFVLNYFWPLFGVRHKDTLAD